MPALDLQTVNSIKARIKLACDNKSIAKVAQFVNLIDKPNPKFTKTHMTAFYNGLIKERTLINSFYSEINAALNPQNGDEKQGASSKNSGTQTLPGKYAATLVAQMAAQNKTSLSQLNDAQTNLRRQLEDTLATVNDLAEVNWGAKFDSQYPGVRQPSTAQSATIALKPIYVKA